MEKKKLYIYIYKWPFLHHKRVKENGHRRQLIDSIACGIIIVYYLNLFRPLFLIQPLRSLCSSFASLSLSLSLSVYLRDRVREMGALRSSSVAVDHEGNDAQIPEEEAHHDQKDLDAGALFVLKSKGTDHYFHYFFFPFQIQTFCSFLAGLHHHHIFSVLLLFNYLIFSAWLKCH
jgi:hypothetical protein